MHILKNPRWNIRENRVTDEKLFTNRRKFMLGFSTLALGGTFSAIPQEQLVHAEHSGINSQEIFKNKSFNPIAEVTPENLSSRYNNFFEFGSTKNIWKEAQKLNTEDWTITISGLVEKPFKVDIESLITRFSLEERIYRHRCVEAWSMVIPWIGFPLSKLVSFSKPLSTAKFIEFKTFFNPTEASEQKARWYPWPYVEGLTLEEAQNELSFLVMGAYGKNLHKQFGAPLRLHLPWKYGFKSIKSIVSLRFTAERPISFWETLASNEYGFWANVNPDVAHPRWSQKTERVLGGNSRNTEIYNGYGPEVSHLYSKYQNLGDKLFM